MWCFSCVFLSAAIDHEILQLRLESIGVKGSTLEWIYSYRSNRTQAVNINGTLSAHAPLHFGVSQGISPGAIAFLPPTLGLSQISTQCTPLCR